MKAESEFGDPLNLYLVHHPEIVLQRLLWNAVSLVNMSKMYKQIGGFFVKKIGVNNVGGDFFIIF